MTKKQSQKNNDWNKIKKTRRESLGEIPQEASDNLNSPEVAPTTKKLGRIKKSKRNKPVGIKLEENFFWKLKTLASQHKILLVELIEGALNDYEKKLEAIKKGKKVCKCYDEGDKG